jgi:hypothetical protein
MFKIRNLQKTEQRMTKNMVLLLLLSLTACSNKNIDDAKKAIEAGLKDPLSAQYQNVIEYGGGVVCGAVNAKNSMGGYVGFKPFIYNGKSPGYLEQRDDPLIIGYWCREDNPRKKIPELEKELNVLEIRIANGEKECAATKEEKKCTEDITGRALESATRKLLETMLEGQKSF